MLMHRLSTVGPRFAPCAQPRRASLVTRASVSTTIHSAPPVIQPNVPDILKNVKPKLLIDGEFVDAASGKTIPIVDPRNEQVVIEVAEADVEDVNRAVKAARVAFDEARQERGRLMFKWADLIEQNLEEFARLETLDNGKPLTVSRNVDIRGVIDHIRYFAGWADKITGKTIPVDGSLFAYTLHEPVGVVGQVIPTFGVLVGHGAGLDHSLEFSIAGRGLETPLTMLRAAELALEAGFPKGVFNVLPGYGPTAGAALASHNDVDKVAFTGSTEVGQKVLQMASGNLKNVTLELGGKSPLIVFPDCDLDKAAEVADFAIYYNHGQCCNAGSRLYAHADIYDALVDKLKTLATSKVVGDPFNDVDQGPQVDADQFNKILGYIDSGREQGAELVCGGHRMGDVGYYIEPTIFANVQDEMKIAREEIFGPVQSIMKFTDTDDVIRRANDSEYGLAAGVITQDIDLANRVSRSLRAGSIFVNTFHQFDHALPFGGYKMSGMGRDKGEYALENYTQVKVVVMPLENSPWL